MISFAYPYLFFLLLLPFVFLYIINPMKSTSSGALLVPFIKDLKEIKNMTNASLFVHAHDSVLFSFRFFSLFVLWALLVTAIARPQLVGEPYRAKTQNRDIMLVIDISPSMLRPIYMQNNRTDRLSAVKWVVGDFINKRKEDRLGLILFGTRAYLQSPLTYDKNAVYDILQNIDAGMAGTTTSVGDALGIALKNLKEHKDRPNKLIILLSDGESNDGALSMKEAIELAEKENIKIYTIGIQEEARFIRSLLGMGASGLDEEGLKELANKTKANYFKATDVNSLKQIYDKIDELEPQDSKGNIIQNKKDLFYVPLVVALIWSILLLIILERKMR